jgi:Rrf2 family cysteine metabolism transcriptional repressor
MQISSKCSYALRAIFVLAERTDPGPLKIAEIAERQKIPLKFLEAILNQLKGGGFVRSQRGVEGGYWLARPADQITVGEVLRFIDGPISPVDGVSPSQFVEGELPGNSAFVEFWEQVDQALSGVVDQTTFAELVRRDRSKREEEEPFVANWSI